MNSDGCNWKKPTFIQRCAPFAEAPSGLNTAIKSARPAKYSGNAHARSRR